MKSQRYTITEAAKHLGVRERCETRSVTGIAKEG
jgi:hypothetical protein